MKGLTGDTSFEPALRECRWFPVFVSDADGLSTEHIDVPVFDSIFKVLAERVNLKLHEVLPTTSKLTMTAVALA